MSKHYEAPVEVRELEKALREFTYRNGLNLLPVFEDFLRHIINGWTLKGYPGLDGWKYTKEQNLEFFKMQQIWVGIMQKQITRHGWYDAFGDLFMSIISTTNAKYNGDYFTPNDACELLAQIIYGNDNKLRFKKIGDHAAGSGRTLLVSNKYMPRNFLEAQDIDYTCCQMAVCNFLIHSCVGIVICMDTLTLKDFRGAWLVNEYFYRTGLPSIRPLNEEQFNRFQNSGIWRALLLDQEGYDRQIKFMQQAAAFKSILNRYDKNKGTTDDG